MSDLHTQFDRLSFNGTGGVGGGARGLQQGYQSLGIPGGAQQVRKQRSQRFTVPTSSPGPSPQQKTRAPIPSIPSLPYQPPPPPVQTQSIAQAPSEAYYSFNRNPPDSSAHTTPDHHNSDVDPMSYNSYNQQPQHQQSPYSTASSGYSNSPFQSTYSGSPASSYARSKDGTMGGGAGLRAGLPTEWMGRDGSAGGYEYERQLQGGYAALVGRPGPDDEVIPTAIVIKNIPFQVPKETLLGIMEDLHLPPPFAFNYHYDNGQFRGLAFANFRVPADAALTVSALNGFDLQGRKLRTEFKKVLKEGEKERIERDKALKRMRSQQLLSADSAGPPPGSWNRREASAPGGYGGAPVDEEDYGQLVQGQFSTAFAGRAYVPAPPVGYGAQVPSGGVYSSSPPSDVGTSISARMTNSSSGSGSDAGVKDLDLNNPQALEIYSRVLIFKDDSLRDELAFARSLSAIQRRTVHLVAKKLGLEHRSVGDGDDRHVVVFKAGAGPPPGSAPKALRHSSSTLNRQPSRDFQSSRVDSPSSNSNGSSYLSPPSPSPLPSLARSSKKSMPDLRSQNSLPRRSAANPGYASMGRAPASRPSVQGLFSGFDQTPVPAIPKEYAYQQPQQSIPGGREGSDEGATTGANGQGLAVRMPRGPGEEGFGRGTSPGREQ